MHIDVSDLQALVHHETDKGVLIVKVAFPSIGLWINGWTVRKSINHPNQGLWIQPPSIRTGSRWVKTLEFRNDSPLLDLIKEEILRAVDRWQREKAVPLDGVELEGDERERAIDVFSD